MGNVKADLLAKRGANTTAYGPEPFFPITEKRCRTVCNNEMNESMGQRWRAIDSASHTKKFIPAPSVQLTDQFLNLTKLEISVTVGILTGHIRLNKYLKTIGVRDDPDCEYCGETEESAQHFLCDCTALSQHRKVIYNKNTLLPNEVMSTSLKKIVHFVRRSGRFPSLGNYQIQTQILNRHGPRRSTPHVDMTSVQTSSQQTNG